MITQDQGLDLEALEGMLDRHGLSGILQMLSHIAVEKADHIQTNWQDGQLAKTWDLNADFLLKAAKYMED